jgi:hypothetical protein
VNGPPWGKRLVLSTVVGVVFALLPGAAAASVIVYRCGSPAELCQINPDGTGQKQLTSDGASAAYHGASLDPAGTRMVFTRDTSSLYASDGSAQNVVGPISTFSELPKISSDGTEVVDDEFYPSLDAYYICTFSTNGSTTRTCDYGTGRFATFTPSGQILASILKSGHDEVCEYTEGTGCTTDVAVDPTTDLDEAAVSPDGTTLAVVAVTPGGSDPAGGHIALYSMSSHTLLRNVTTGTVDETPAWSPDGSRIVFSRGGNLYVIGANAPPGSEQLLVDGGDTPTWGGPAGAHDGNPSGPTAPPPHPPSQSGPTVSVLHPAKIKDHALFGRGLSIKVTSSGKVAAGVLLVIDKATAKRLHIGKRITDLATETGVVSGSKTFTIKPKAKFRSKLSRARRFTLDVVVVIKDAAGHQATKVYTVTVTR